MSKEQKESDVKIPEGFTEWNGGECPVDENVKVEIILRNGTSRMDDAGRWTWIYSKHGHVRGDIVAYRVVKQEPEELEESLIHPTTGELKPEKPSHYTTNGIETRVKKDMVYDFLEAKIREGKVTASQVDDLGNALKYFDRLGDKSYDGMNVEESAKKDASKCADYIFRFLTGKFLNED